MKTCWSGNIAPTVLALALDGGEMSASRPCRFTPGERTPGTHWIGGWVGLGTGLDAVEKRNILQCRKSNPGLPARSPSLYRLSYPDCSQHHGGNQDLLFLNVCRRILNKYRCVGLWTEFAWVKTGLLASCCENCNETFVYHEKHGVSWIAKRL
jgi:hypothetical protein